MSDEGNNSKKKKRKSADTPTPAAQPALSSSPTDQAIDPFASFQKVLKEKDPELGNLEKPAKPKDIEDADQKLREALLAAPADEAIKDIATGPILPPLFKSFLRRWNGGTAHDTCIYGVGTNDEFDLVDLNARARADDLPAHLVGFAATVQGEIYCFDVSRRRDNGESPIVLVDADEARQYDAASDFAEWLEKLPTLEQELADARGPQPMTVDEWEDFLKREREKLRRLSKTPARDLPVPDPETARQDLGGKIPVDPRHLKPKGGA
ncbi:MAG TPA: SMI1/KNR4 family protein [Planctomycetota bacterium]|nr:SMI1/KNR4 family protein [Planctomycetota bacterium]